MDVDIIMTGLKVAQEERLKITAKLVNDDRKERKPSSAAAPPTPTHLPVPIPSTSPSTLLPLQIVLLLVRTNKNNNSFHHKKLKINHLDYPT